MTALVETAGSASRVDLMIGAAALERPSAGAQTTAEQAPDRIKSSNWFG